MKQDMKYQRLHAGPQLGGNVGQCRRSRDATAHALQYRSCGLQLSPQGDLLFVRVHRPA